MKNHVQTIYKQAERLAAITTTAIKNGNIIRAKKCLASAEKLLINGSAETRNAISNVYLTSVSLFMEIRGVRIANLFPVTLRTEYLKQINAVGV